MRTFVCMFSLLLLLSVGNTPAQAQKTSSRTDSLFLRIGDSILLGTISPAGNEIQLPDLRLDWVKKYPNLRTLHMHIHYRSRYLLQQNKVLTNVLKLPNLEELVCYPAGYCELELPKPLPNLKRLSVDGGLFPAYLYQMPNIEELILDCQLLHKERTLAEYAQDFQKWLLQAKHLRVLQFDYSIANFQGTTAPTSATEGHTLTHLLVGDNANLVEAIFQGRQHLFTNLHTVYWRADYILVSDVMDVLLDFPNIQTLYLKLKMEGDLKDLLTRYTEFFQRLRVLYVPSSHLADPEIEKLRQRLIPNTQLISTDKFQLIAKPFKF